MQRVCAKSASSGCSGNKDNDRGSYRSVGYRSSKNSIQFTTEGVIRMATSFLLRFQEYCEETCVGEVFAGVKTITKTLGDKTDSASTEAVFKTLIAGTSTVTRVQSEQGDSDYADANRTIPVGPKMATKTTTAIQMEGDDQKPRHHGIRVLPKCS